MIPRKESKISVILGISSRSSVDNGNRGHGCSGFILAQKIHILQRVMQSAYQSRHEFIAVGILEIIWGKRLPPDTFFC